MSVRFTYLNLIEHEAGWEFDVSPIRIPPMMGEGDACLGSFRTDLPMSQVLHYLGSFHDSYGERDASLILQALKDSQVFEQLAWFSRAS